MASPDFDGNRKLLKEAAAALGPLLDRVAFVGGATTILHLREPLLDVRGTTDVDVIVGMTRAEFQDAEEQLRKLGFSPDLAVICRHRKGDLVIDFMPTDGSILGFSNRWYHDALSQAESVDLDGTQIRILTFPYFVATKLEAFEGRGNGDYLASKDIEDLVAVFAGRPAFLSELSEVTGELGRFIRSKLDTHLRNEEFSIALATNLPRDAKVSVERIVADLRELADET